MTAENRQWQQIKENYLNQIREVLSAANQPGSEEIIDNVSSHLDQRFAELKAEQQSWENFQKIITEMGPPSDYAELLVCDAKPAKKHLPVKYLLGGILGLISIAAVVILTLWIISHQAKPVTIEKFRENFSRNIKNFNIDAATLQDVIKTFGQPQSYVWGDKTLKKSDLPARYVIMYPCEFNVFINNGKIVELRFEGPDAGYIFKDKIKVGSSLDEVIEALGQPEKTVTGQKNMFADGVLYKDIEGRDGFCYYARQTHHIRLFFVNNRVHALYITRSDYHDGP
jgi:hypothetical protein